MGSQRDIKALRSSSQLWTDQSVILVDIRPEGIRRKEGIIPGALHIERNVLEWRLDPRGKVTGSVGRDGKVVEEGDPEGGRLAIADR